MFKGYNITMTYARQLGFHGRVHPLRGNCTISDNNYNIVSLKCMGYYYCCCLQRMANSVACGVGDSIRAVYN